MANLFDYLTIDKEYQYDSTLRNHVLISGSTGKGMTSCIRDTILKDLLKNENEIHIISIKDEYEAFKNTDSAFGFSNNLESLDKDISLIIEKIKERKMKFRDSLVCNIDEYNKINTEKMSYIYLVIEDFDFINIDKLDTDKLAKVKESVLNNLKSLFKYGKAYGISVFISSKKPVNDHLIRACSDKVEFKSDGEESKLFVQE